MVFDNPNLLRVKRELGVLYYRLGSYEMAKSYLQSAIQGEGVPGEVRARVNSYIGSKGAGVSIAMPITLGYFEPFAEVRDRHFANTPDFTNAAEQTGRLWITGAAATGDLVAPDLHWQARLTYAIASTRREYTNDEQVAFDADFPIEFAGPCGAQHSLVTPFAGVSKTDYAGPNAFVDPNLRRRELEVRGGVQVDLPLWDNVGLAAPLQYATVDASLCNDRTSNLSVLFGPTLRY